MLSAVINFPGDCLAARLGTEDERKGPRGHAEDFEEVDPGSVRQVLRRDYAVDLAVESVACSGDAVSDLDAEPTVLVLEVTGCRRREPLVVGHLQQVDTTTHALPALLP